MKRPQIIVTVIAVILTAALFGLPKVVVDNESDEVTEDGGPAPQSIRQTHEQEVPAEESAVISQLQRKLRRAESTEKSAIFADSLAQAYLDLNILDSAVFYVETAADANPGEEYWERAGDICFEALSFSMDKDRSKLFGEKTRFYYQKILDSSPDRLDLKSKIAVTHVSTSNPMKGITMLREVIEEDPNNQEAIFNLGVLSLQSTQYDKAIERFEKLVDLNPDHMQGQVLLGISLKESGQRDAARSQFEKVKVMTGDSSILATVESYLEDIN